DDQGKPKTCTKCTGADKDKPIIGLVIVKDLSADGDRYKGGTILDPADGKIYKAEMWLEDGAPKVRGYLGVFYKTQTGVKGGWGRGGRGRGDRPGRRHRAEYNVTAPEPRDRKAARTIGTPRRLKHESEGDISCVSRPSQW